MIRSSLRTCRRHTEKPSSTPTCLMQMRTATPLQRVTVMTPMPPSIPVPRKHPVMGWMPIATRRRHLKPVARHPVILSTTKALETIDDHWLHGVRHPQSAWPNHLHHWGKHRMDLKPPVRTARGGRVLLGCRSQQRGTQAMERIRAQHPSADLVLVPLDLADLDSVAAAAAVVNQQPKLDVLINNMGSCGPRNENYDGLRRIDQPPGAFRPDRAPHVPAVEHPACARVVNIASLGA